MIAVLRAARPAALAIGLCLSVTSWSTAASPETHDSRTGAAHAEHGAEHHAPALSDLLFPAVNFAIYLVIVVRFVIPAMREYLRRRQADIVQLEAEATTALAGAERDLAAVKGRLAGLDVEMRAIRDDLVAVATRQAERLVAQAEESGARRVADASLLAEQERRRAVAGIRSELAREAAKIAEQRIRTALTAEDERAFVHTFLREATTR